MPLYLAPKLVHALKQLMSIKKTTVLSHAHSLVLKQITGRSNKSHFGVQGGREPDMTQQHNPLLSAVKAKLDRLLQISDHTKTRMNGQEEPRKCQMTL